MGLRKVLLFLNPPISDASRQLSRRLLYSSGPPLFLHPVSLLVGIHIRIIRRHQKEEFGL